MRKTIVRRPNAWTRLYLVLVKEAFIIDTAIVVVDPQKGWLNQHTKPTIHRLAEVVHRHACWPCVVVTVFVNDAQSPFRHLLPWWNGFKSEEDTDLIPAFSHPQITAFPRNTYGLPSQMWDYFSRHNVRQMVLTGLETDATIVKTAMDAFDRHLAVYVPPHLVASTYGPLGQENGLAILKKVLGRDHFLNESQVHQLLSQCTP